MKKIKYNIIPILLLIILTILLIKVTKSGVEDCMNYGNSENFCMKNL